MSRKPWKGDFKVSKSKKLPEGARPRNGLEACAFAVRLGNRSVFILDPRLVCNFLGESVNWVLPSRLI